MAARSHPARHGHALLWAQPAPDGRYYLSLLELPSGVWHIDLVPAHADGGLRLALGAVGEDAGAGGLRASLWGGLAGCAGDLRFPSGTGVALGGDGGGTRGAAQPLPERASRRAGRRGRPGGDACAVNRACDLDAQLDGDARARRFGQRDAPAVL